MNSSALTGGPTRLSRRKRKIKRLQELRLAQWEKLVDAVYRRRGWDKNGIPPSKSSKSSGLDFESVVAV